MIGAFIPINAAPTDQTQVSEASIGPKNSVSEAPASSPEFLQSEGFAVAAKQQEGSALARCPPAGNDFDIEWPHRLAAVNRYLLSEINSMRAQLAVARAGMGLLDSVAGDWSEAQRVLNAWREATT